MAFSEETKNQAFTRSHGRCECTREHKGRKAPHHGGQCELTFSRHGNWHAHHKTAEDSGGDNLLSNCEALCIPCHHLTKTYGNS
ncbi:MAG: HNH endonuclease [Candidatus Nanoarchaeia archaeon]|nr:HNH endonuclease [Candidatus Nanoarchaeia archaeon]